ncbi:hypothetical protein niasHS_012979 [Heterodera schachtii]|uniref:Uncharacterized protein n=1 Tax=Heterodera schachtii TaxID=97005 RepID=A0ABD2ISR9_HETSC
MQKGSIVHYLEEGARKKRAAELKREKTQAISKLWNKYKSERNRIQEEYSAAIALVEFSSAWPAPNIQSANSIWTGPDPNIPSTSAAWPEPKVIAKESSNDYWTGLLSPVSPAEKK